ncbi:glycoside hydrolase family 36 protein [Vibrio tetraodonis]|uniref:glycoside hydrolase family 36 protein n=1 Tax=Vibrio tetraodonis TaxID=2231647 RepID=UPI000E0B2092|nr:alpha-galactosidase [Vibrio tetraodonis]
MSFSVTLENGHNLRVRDINLHAQVDTNEVTFVYQGLSNDPCSSSYVLAITEFVFDHNAVLLGDEFQMSSQTTGTVDNPEDVGTHSDQSSPYQFYSASSPKRYYNYLLVEEATCYTLFGFTSCYRFAGYFELVEVEQHQWIKICIDAEETCPQDWSSNQLESIAILKGDSLAELFAEYTHLVSCHHSEKKGVKKDAPLVCCYPPDVSESFVKDNLSQIEDGFESLDYVMIDEGYQACIGDWLIPSDQFPSGIKSLSKEIKRCGKKPALWLAPFVVHEESEVFRHHSDDWLVTHSDGSLLRVEDIAYEGGRSKSGYILDTTNPDVQEHLSHILVTMRKEWGIQLFKLDALFWGSVRGCRQQDGITGVEAYRLGMEAINDGVGNALILGCNAPLWPSLGMVDAMRVSSFRDSDNKCFIEDAREAFFRSWQHRRLWQIAPGYATLIPLPNAPFEQTHVEFHRNALLACGGVLMSGDPLTQLNHFAKSTLSRLFVRHKHNQNSARFSSLSLDHAYLRMNDRNDLHCLFNFQACKQTMCLTSTRPVDWHDYWSGKKLNVQRTDVFEVEVKALSSKAILTKR